MQEIAEQIIKKARMMPIDTGVTLECNGARITKVAVTGGFGWEVTSANKKSLLFPMAHMKAAVESFLTAGHCAEVEHCLKYRPTICHGNGLQLLQFDWHWHEDKDNEKVKRRLYNLLLDPPLSSDMHSLAKASLSFDSRGYIGWDIDSVVEEKSSDDEKIDEDSAADTSSELDEEDNE